MALHHMLRAAAGNAGPSDPYFEYNTLLLTGDGTNGAQNNTFLDSSTNNFTITRNGNTTQGTFSPYGPNWSNYFDGAGDYLTAPNNAAFAFGTGDFSIELWAYHTTSSSLITYFTTNASDTNGLIFGRRATNKLYVSHNSVSDIVESTADIPINQWVHLAVTRSSGTVRIFINGTVSGTTSYTGNFISNTAQQISGISTSYIMSGYISNLRVVKGSAVYTSAFTPSTTPLTAVSGTSLLTCQSNRFIDNSSNNFTLTVNGNTSVQRFSPFNPTAPYSAATIGGSGYFDGNGDYLTAPNNAAFAFGTGDFTVDGWFYLTSSNSDQCLVDFRTNTSSSTGFFLGIVTSGYFQVWNGSNIIYVNAGIGLNNWYHFAISRSGTTFKAFINGVEIASVSNTTNWTDQVCSIGYGGGGSQQLAGYLSNFRIVKGTAVYTSAFTPPTSPVTAVSGTSLLCNMTNAGIPDAAMMNDLETVGNAQVSTSVKKYGTGSIYMDGTSDGLPMAYTPNLELKNTYTIEAWIYPATTSGWHPIFNVQAANTTSFGTVTLAQNGTAVIYEVKTLSGSGTGVYYSISGGTLTTNTWFHVAVSVSNNSAKLFVNGTQVGSTTTITDYGFTPVGASVGSNANGFNASTEVFNGYIDDLRITKGYARYTTNFTPPTAALPTY